MNSTGNLGTLLEEIAKIDTQLAESMQQLETNWHSGAARDTELSELTAGALLEGVSSGLFALPGIVDAFNAFAREYHERQIEFVRSGKYRATSYAEVNRDVYSN